MVFIKNLKNVQKKHKNLIIFLKGVVKLQQKTMFKFEEYQKIKKNIQIGRKALNEKQRLISVRRLLKQMKVLK